MANAGKLGLARPQLRAWALYDWANSAFLTVVVSTVFPVFFSAYSNAGTVSANPESNLPGTRLAWGTTIALAVVALLAPILGSVADARPWKRKFLFAFMLVGASATGCMFFLQKDQWFFALVLFGIGNVGAMSSFVFYDSLLPHIAAPDEVDKVSTAGYALGYLGGGLVLFFCLTIIQKPHLLGIEDAATATKLCFPVVALWWIVFSIPLFRQIPEPAIHARAQSVFASPFAKLRTTFKDLLHYKQAASFLLAFLIYNDGIGTIFRFAVIFGAEIGLETKDMITAILLVQLVGIPCTFAFGSLATKFGSKRAIYLGLAVYVGVTILGFFMQTTLHFYCLAVLVGLVQGGVQALSRSLFATMIPKERSSEFFGLFAVFEKFAGVFGPLVFVAVGFWSESSRPAILAIMLFFLLGAFLLRKVDVAAGQKQALQTN